MVLFLCAVFGIIAQDISLTADNYLSATPGDVEYNADQNGIFWSKTVSAGGSVNLADSGIQVKCYDYMTDTEYIVELSGYISDKPNLQFDYGEYGMFNDIFLWVEADADTVLLIACKFEDYPLFWSFCDDSDGSWSEYKGKNPVLPLGSSDSYHYYVWVGTKKPGKQVNADIYISAWPPSN